MFFQFQSFFLWTFHIRGYFNLQFIYFSKNFENSKKFKKAQNQSFKTTHSEPT